MLVYFPGGATANIPPDTIGLGAFGTSAYPPVIANAGLMGAVTSGSMNPYRTSTFGTLLVQTDGGTTKVWVRLDSQQAAIDAYNNIGIALEADDQAIYIFGDGTYVVVTAS